MNRFVCDGSYENDLREYAEQVLERSGVSSQSAEREVLCLADRGNTVAAKLFADMIFYKKILRGNPCRDAFFLYLRSAGISIDENGNWSCSGRSYPPAFRDVAYYLVSYHRDSFLRNCEDIPVLDEMSVPRRLALALELCAACLQYVDSAEAVNLTGRILKEVSENEPLFADLAPVIQETVAGREFPEMELTAGPCADPAGCGETAMGFFRAAARKGYSYACNNLAAREADRILQLSRKGGDPDALRQSIEAYIVYLTLAADKYEPYAANRLGLLYMTGEIRGGDGCAYFREYCNTARAKEYFQKATVYPDANSAWAFLNLIKYFQRDYDTDIELLNEHMACIRELNPKVYDIAIDL